MVGAKRDRKMSLTHLLASGSSLSGTGSETGAQVACHMADSAQYWRQTDPGYGHHSSNQGRLWGRTLETE